MFDESSLYNWLSEKSGLPASEVAPETSIFQSGLLDSFDLVELVSYVETETGRRVKPMDINMRNFDTIAQILAYVRRTETA